MKKTPLMFSGKRTMKELKKLVINAGGGWDQSRYDNEGSDYVTFTFRGKVVVYNTFNGRFIVKIRDKYVTEESVEFEKYKWYVDLLNMIFLPLKEAA